MSSIVLKIDITVFDVDATINIHFFISLSILQSFIYTKLTNIEMLIENSKISLCPAVCIISKQSDAFTFFFFRIKTYKIYPLFTSTFFWCMEGQMFNGILKSSTNILRKMASSASQHFYSIYFLNIYFF